ncbi:transcriptional regulator [Acinetobacter baumannii]|uniref:transcriptional regulator n=1 Tax=Acinetobacter baumannii TaxID=470 RepID=UPI000C080E13|nr:transcriptional regulator [Acinetobacter baumannii]MBC6785699.1 transcriptional regulator [Acinetobacter baumannii]MBC6812793.1 transcriptional regulator [Acinetobacter baumannii]MBC6825068.1 transcriptional regulator [Acinetobacter baumannii]MCU6804393.1 transcriptional regulator [Acinetobacter baumannii]PHP83906.1 transcriptional regulator [Acinetobacter baumannii]
MSINDKFLERGARLKAERKRLKLTQPAVAELLDVAVGSIVRYEKQGDPLNQNQLTVLQEAGFDTFYVTFGVRYTELSDDEHEIISAYRCLNDDVAKMGFVRMAKAYSA